ncbi:MAG TPA: NUDIX domain-containing protein [Ginsengibacter sp.]|nr:NUDIX domain-containing protein [Chitinophagaceae bacterium]HRN73718.1 NUDIX domain-containing protein [Ginsengibacter sp.]HRP43525.1 NUDIX domain-containing protein [Ginsengibacter sp.]
MAATVEKTLKGLQTEVQSTNKMAISVDCVIFGFDENTLKVLLIRSDLKKYKGKWTLLGDLVKPDEDLDAAAYRVLKQRTGMKDVYLEQVKAFGEVDRHPAGRVVTVAYCSLINIQNHQLQILDNEIHWHSVDSLKDKELGFDHERIFDTCYRWLQKRVQEHPLGFNLLPKKFSLRELQNLYEAILSKKLDRRNFRKKFFSMDFLVDTGEEERDVPHRPGKLYKFDFEKYEKKKKVWAGIDF